ncbi:MAG: CDP-alcohol phosphatidyltransferase family protein [Terriglobales bacterium]
MVTRNDCLPFVPAQRIQQSISSAAEKRALVWMAQRTPAWINSDHLTLLGFAGQVLAGVFYALARWDRRALLVVIACLALNWLGDSLDGTLARVRQKQRPRYGFYVDHIVDTFAAFFLMGGLAVSGYVHPAVAMGMLIAFLMMSIEVYLASYTVGSFRLSYGGLGPTEIRILLAIGNVVLLYHPTVTLFGKQFRLFDVGGVVAIGAMLLMLIIASVAHTAQLYDEEKAA